MLDAIFKALPHGIMSILPFKRAELEARLAGVDGFTGRGEIEFIIWNNGGRALDVELRGVAGRTAEIYANNALAATVDLDNGRADCIFDTRKGDAVPDLIEGARIEVRQNGDVILDGVLVPD